MSEIAKIGVIGAGQMGNGIAHVCALAGYDVFLNDQSADRIKEGLATINGNMARQVSRELITEDELLIDGETIKLIAVISGG